MPPAPPQYQPVPVQYQQPQADSGAAMSDLAPSGNPNPAAVQQVVPQQQYYYAPPQPAKEKGSIPPFVYVGLGVALAVIVPKFLAGKKQDMQSMMMQQMMKQFTSQAGGGMPGAGMPGMPGMPPSGGFGGGDAFPPFPGMQTPPPKPSAATQRYTDTTATPVTTPSSSSSSAASTTTTTSSSSSKRGSATKTVDTVSDAEEKKAEESELTWVGESSSSSSSTAAKEEAPKKAFFEDAVETEASTSSSSSNMFQDAADMPDEEDDEASLEYMKNMIRNPEMQKLMYPYLPEFMRNPETFEMLLNNPQYKDQLKGIMKSMKSSGAMPGGGMGGAMPDINSPEVQEQFAAMGMKPEDVLTQIMQDPELASAFQNPKVQAAVMDCSANPMNITKYQNDPEVMKTFEKLASLFPQAGGGAPPPGMF